MTVANNKILIRKISWENVRNFEQLQLPDNDNNLNDSTSLVQIQNGYGKTTTLYLLRSIFTSQPIDKKYVKSGYRYRYPHTNWGGDQNSPSKFYVEFDINDEFCRIGIEIDHQNMQQKFTTFREKLGGEKDGWIPPQVFRKLFEKKDDFAKLFVLDGELAKELNRATGSEVVNNSIKQVTNLAGLHTLVGSGNETGQITRVKQEKLSSLLGGADKRSEKLKNTLEILQQTIEFQRGKLKDAKQEIADTKQEIIDSKQQLDDLDSKISQNSEDLEDAKKQLGISSRELEKRSLSVLNRLFKPAFAYPKWTEVQQYHASQVKAKLPRSVGRTWFKEVMDLGNCICGRKWDDPSKEYVRNHLEDYLDSRVMTYVKEMQDAVAEHSSSTTLAGEIKRIKDGQIKNVQNSQRVDDIRSKASQKDREKYKELNEEIGKMKEMLVSWEYIRDEIGSEKLEFIKEWSLNKDMYNTDGTITKDMAKIKRIDNIKCLRDIEFEIEKEIAQIGGAQNIADGAELIQKIISEVLSKVEEEIKIELENRMNSSISKMVGAGLDGGLEVRITSSGLQYYNPNGDLQLGVNMAAELGGTYAFISALYEYAEVSIPLVLDSPLAGFGQGMSAAWTELVPPTFDQVIALINSSEMISLKGWFEANDIDCYLIRRSGENITTGRPQTGKMIIDSDKKNFTNYESDVLKRGGE
jgi:DNA sulfur modification protein DndD